MIGIRTLEGDGALEALTVTHAGTEHRLDVTALFVFIGAEPCTAWLGGRLAVDERGFVLAGPDLRLTHLDPAGNHRPPLPLETSVAGVFVAGDARAGATNRVASAVGDGALAVRLIHEYLGVIHAAH